MLMACMFAVGWVRSQLVFDDSIRNFGGYRYMIMSFDGMIQFGRTSEFQGFAPVIWDSGKLSQLSGFELDDNGARRPFDPWESIEVDWRWDCGRFHFGSGMMKWRTGDLKCGYYIVPYWSIVIPLTLVSAFLLFSKPPISNQRQVAEPPANERA
jgi:hypothetical protein